MNCKYSIVVPVYNEEQAAEETIRALDQVLSASYPGDGYEIIAVDDGSQDASGEVLKRLQNHIANLDVLVHPQNRGYGAALKTGIRHARHDVIVITDADGTYPSEGIPRLTNLLEQGSDMAVGARTAPGARIPLVRKPAKWAIRRLAEYLGGEKIPDLNSGLRAIRKDVVRQFWRVLPDGFSFTATITLAALSSGFQVTYVPIEYHKRGGKSKFRPIRDTLNFIQLVVRTVMYFNPLKVFVPLSAIFIGLSVLVGVVSRLLTGQVMDVIAVVLFVTGVQIMVTGMLADLIDKRNQSQEW